ncbi:MULTISPECIES: Hsp20/alpha crystallin family protein [Bacillales]|uniref:Hsp20/alpha crystallin family protein n=1 Tax=Bacillales TaxID=1385 RepID=UPI00096CA9BF|nr:Hsp20/alpha crystallin family protein [Paenibacillus sp. FSL R5-0490]OMF60121.1 hypothetical protein BK139_11415 [Paenibacillus sp. FSL R5-0490]
MDIEKIRKWLEITNEYQNSHFWTSVLQNKYVNESRHREEAFPKCDIYQNESYNFVIFEIPGLDPSEISLNLISSKQLKISGHVKRFYPDQIVVKRERTYGDFQRTIELPEPADPQYMRTEIQSGGLLQIAYPREVENIYFPQS